MDREAWPVYPSSSHVARFLPYLSGESVGLISRWSLVRFQPGVTPYSEVVLDTCFIPPETWPEAGKAHRTTPTPDPPCTVPPKSDRLGVSRRNRQILRKRDQPCLPQRCGPARVMAHPNGSSTRNYASCGPPFLQARGLVQISHLFSVTTWLTSSP